MNAPASVPRDGERAVERIQTKHWQSPHQTCTRVGKVGPIMTKHTDYWFSTDMDPGSVWGVANTVMTLIRSEPIDGH